jgi:hypothetical protein
MDCSYWPLLGHLSMGPQTNSEQSIDTLPSAWEET